MAVDAGNELPISNAQNFEKCVRVFFFPMWNNNKVNFKTLKKGATTDLFRYLLTPLFDISSWCRTTLKILHFESAFEKPSGVRQQCRVVGAPFKLLLEGGIAAFESLQGPKHRKQ